MKTNFTSLSISVVDPFHFDLDPDPDRLKRIRIRIRIRPNETDPYGSGSTTLLSIEIVRAISDQAEALNVGESVQDVVDSAGKVILEELDFANLGQSRVQSGIENCSCSYCQELCQQESLLLICSKRVSNKSAS